MRITSRWLVITLVFMFFAACAADMSDAFSDRENTVASKEVVVRLCADMSMQQATITFTRHSLWINKRLSVNLLIVEWGDERSVDNVIKELEAVSGICSVQPNYGYGIAPAEGGLSR